MNPRSKVIDRSTDVRTNKTSISHFVLNFWHRSGAGDHRLAETRDSNMMAFAQFLKDMYGNTGTCIGPQ